MICPDWCSLQWSESALFLLVVIQSFSSFSAGSYCYCCMLWRMRDCIDLICTVLWCKMCWTVHLPICCGEGSVTGQSVAWLKLWETYSRVCSPALKKSLKMVPMVPMSWRDKNTPKKAETWLYLSLPYVFHPKHLIWGKQNFCCEKHGIACKAAMTTPAFDCNEDYHLWLLVKLFSHIPLFWIGLCFTVVV